MYKQKIHNFISSIISRQYSVGNVILTVLTIILVRLGIENWLDGFKSKAPHLYLGEFMHTTTFFVIIFLICVILVIKLSTISRKSGIAIFLFAFLMIILPPILDHIISAMYFDGINFYSYYLFDNPEGLVKSFFTFFGDKPRDGITYGTRIMIFLTLIFLGIITWLKTKKVSKTLTTIFVAYVLFFIMSSLPSLLSYIVLPQHMNVGGGDVAGFITSPTAVLGNQITNPINAASIKLSLVYLLLLIVLLSLIFFRTHKDLFISLLKNVRPVQTAYHIGLLVMGMYIAITFGGAIILPTFFTVLAFILLCIAIVFAWYSTVIFNDCVDQKIDAISNPQRPLITKIINVSSYKKIGFTFLVLSLIITALINGLAVFILIIYHALSFLYNTEPLRLKRFPILATLTAAIASFFIVVIGFVTLVPHHSISDFPPHIAILLIVVYTISLPIKDLKDIDGDRASNIYTIPVLFGKETSRIIIAISIFTSFMLSIFTLGTKSLLVPALLAGALSFWTLVGQKNQKFIFDSRQVLLIVFLIVSIYSIILAVSLFG